MRHKRIAVLEQYNGETKVDLPELDQTKMPSVANLLGLGLDQFAQRIASVLPDISYPSLRPGFDTWDSKARMSRMANLGWWDMNRMPLLEYKRARYLLAFASAPVSIHPTATNESDKRKIPHWRIRSPLNTFPAVATDELDCEPSDYIVCHEYPLSWLQDKYPAQVSVLYKGRSSAVNRDMKFEVLEYNDADETVLVACGQTKEERQSGDWQESSAGSASSVVLSRLPNRAGICNMVVPGRIVLDRPTGHFDTMLHLFASQARMAAYEELGIYRGIFPESWVMSHPNAPTRPKIIRNADSKNGVVGLIENGVIQTVTLNPGAQVPTAIDRLERAARLAGGIPAEFGGEAASNIRTGRRGAQVMGDTVDMPLQEYQEILASAKNAENLRAVETMKANYGTTVSMYMGIPRNGKINDIPNNPATYTPKDIFVTSESKAVYPFLGSDSSSIPIEIGQRVGTGEMSLQTARELDPKISDPVQEANRVISEGLEKALLGGMEQQLAAGGLDPAVVAKIEIALRKDPSKHFADIYVTVHEEMQKQQAAMQAAQPPQPAALGAGPPPPGGGATPQQMPGAAVPPGGAAAQGQPSIPPPGQGQQNLAQLVSVLGQGAKGPGQ
jgi:hypothetical protein